MDDKKEKQTAEKSENKRDYQPVDLIAAAMQELKIIPDHFFEVVKETLYKQALWQLVTGKEHKTIITPRVEDGILDGFEISQENEQDFECTTQEAWNAVQNTIMFDQDIKRARCSNKLPDILGHIFGRIKEKAEQKADPEKEAA